MSLIGNQIKERIESDDQQFSDSFLHLASSVNGKKYFSNMFEIIQDSFDAILTFYHYSNNYKVPDNVDTFYGKLDCVCSATGLAYREVKLTPGWYKDALGAYIAFRKEDHSPVTLLPCRGGYKFLNNGKYVRINKKNQKEFELEGLVFYRSLPSRKITLWDLVKFALTSVPTRKYVALVCFMLFSTLIGLLTPKLSYLLYGPVVEQSSSILLLTTIGFLVSVTISTLLLNTFKSMLSNVIERNMNMALSGAVLMRVFSLQPSFFRKYSSGEISSRASIVSSLASSIISLIFNTGISSLFSLAYITSILEYAPSLVVPAIIIILVTVAFSVVSALANIRITRKRLEISAKENGVSFSMINGITKIRLAGAEKRMFSKWANTYAEQARYSYSPGTFIKYNNVFSLIISLAGTIILYFFAIQSKVSVSEYNAFTTAYGMVFGAFTALSSIALTAAELKPTYDLAKPILEAEPEKKENKELVTELSGNINISNVSFRYSESSPVILDNVSFKISPGQYVAVVGKTGCGKSTLVRLLLGFESPQKGSIYFDGKDISSLNLKSLRRKIGTVMQDGKLFQGTIFSNIALCAPELDLKGAFEAADIAGIGDDIREMPMGMSTMLSDGGNGISGGQRQRILIARAIAAKPKILILDEATSALDNITQKKVSEALDKLKCTRIVIAHRLFTIKQCDRIIYLENGKIKEDGTYDELIKKNGAFADLVRRQMIVDNK